MRSHNRHRVLARLPLAVAALAVVALGYVAFTAWQVWRSSEQDNREVVHALVVLGAAQYDGRPSPVLRARLDHASTLYEAGYVREIWVTGYNRPGDRFTEAQVSAAYLERHGIPGNRIERITVGATTSYRTLVAAARELRRDGIDNVLLVSDPYHSYRIAAIAEEVGLEAKVSAAADSPTTGPGGWRQLARETVAVAVGRIVGYDRLDRLGLVLDDAGVPRR